MSDQTRSPQEIPNCRAVSESFRHLKQSSCESEVSKPLGMLEMTAGLSDGRGVHASCLPLNRLAIGAVRGRIYMSAIDAKVLFRVMGKARGEIDKYDLYLHDRREASKEGTNMGFQSDFPHDTCDRQISSSGHVYDKSVALDRERLEVASLRQDIIDEYEKKSAELLEYLDSMESAFEYQRLEYEERQKNLRLENEELRHELAHGCRARVAELLEKDQEREEDAHYVVQAVQVLKSEMKEKERVAKKDHRKVKELQLMVEELQWTIEKKEEEHENVGRREKKARKHIEEENDVLRRKAALGWMLGCLSELYLRLDPDIGAGRILKLVRKVQRELESGNRVFSTGGMTPPKLEYELIQREIRRLINAGNSNTLPSLAQKLRINSSVVRTAKPKQFTRELPGDRRKKLRLSKSLREQAQAAQRSFSAPSEVPSRKEVAACEGFVLKDHLKQKHHVSCHKDVQKKDWGTWKKLRLLKMDQAAKETSYREIKKVLQGLESSMTYLLGQERRRRLNNQSRI
uniref:Uncharacterized protein n=3 Tax=Physcomitrium patens TaxID=3218 RepID=A0A7I4BX19_PHYPA